MTNSVNTPSLPNAHFHPLALLPNANSKEPFPFFESQSYLPQKTFIAKGIHPWTVAQLSSDFPQQINYLLGNLISDNPTTIDAIGEIGLDFTPSHLPSSTTKPLQIKIFKSQYLFAQEHSLSVILHLVKATDPFIQLLKNFPPTTPLLFHKFQGSSQQLEQLLKWATAQPFYFSFSPSNTFPQTAMTSKQSEAIRLCPLENLLIEDETITDPTEANPTLALFYQEVAKIKEISLDFLIQTIAKNIVSFYN